jgi:probable rRNA maturation factor
MQICIAGPIFNSNQLARASSMNTYVYQTQKRFPIDPDSVSAVVKSVLEGENQQADEVAIYFVGKSKICSLHAQYFDDPSLTDCISFPVDGPSTVGYRMLGEVFVCPEMGFKQLSTAERQDLNALYMEFTLYVVHGLLHLLGYDDIDPHDIAVMREKEKFHLSRLQGKGLKPPKGS